MLKKLTMSCIISFASTFLAVRFWFDLTPEINIQQNYTKAFFPVSLFSEENISISCSCVSS